MPYAIVYNDYKSLRAALRQREPRAPFAYYYWDSSITYSLFRLSLVHADSFLRKATLIMTTIGYFLIWISNHKISVLFHSPLKVLFSFPSQYLFAIGLWLIFRISRNLPALLNSNLKEFDSRYRKVYTARNSIDIYGTITLYVGTFQ